MKISQPAGQPASYKFWEMPTIKLSENERKAAKVATAVGGAVAGAVSGAVKGAIKGASRAVSQQQQQQQQQAPSIPVAAAVVVGPGQPQTYPHPTAQQASMLQAPAPHGQMIAANSQQTAVEIAEMARFVGTAFAGTEFPPRQACLLCGAQI